MRAIFHKQLLLHIAQTHFTSRFSVLDPGTVYDPDTNEPVTVYVENDLLKDIPGHLEPILASTAANEIRRKDGTIVREAWNLSLARYLPQLSEDQNVQDENGLQYNILNVATTRSGITALVLERVDSEPHEG